MSRLWKKRLLAQEAQSKEHARLLEAQGRDLRQYGKELENIKKKQQEVSNYLLPDEDTPRPAVLWIKQYAPRRRPHKTQANEYAYDDKLMGTTW